MEIHREIDANNSDDGIEDKGGNRENLVESISRVNKRGYAEKSVNIIRDLNQVQLIRPDSFKLYSNAHQLPIESFSLDDTVDNIDNGSNKIFCDQDDIYERFKISLYKRRAIDSPSIAVLGLGGCGSGKSYTLFGNCDENNNRGILPRFLEEIFFNTEFNHFNASHVQIGGAIVNNEQITDLYNPSQSFSYQGSFAYSSSLGVLLLPTHTTIHTNAVQCLTTLRNLLQSASYILANDNSSDVFNNCHLIFQVRVMSKENNHYFTATFAEIASLSVPNPKTNTANNSLDRLAGTSLSYTSVNALKKSVNNKKGKIVSAENRMKDIEVIIHESVLTYLFQDELYKQPDCYVVACLRGDQDAFHDNYNCLDFINKLDVSSAARSVDNSDIGVLKSSKLNVVFKALKIEIELETGKLKYLVDEDIKESTNRQKKMSIQESLKMANDKPSRDREVLPSSKHSNIYSDNYLVSLQYEKVSYLMKIFDSISSIMSNNNVDAMIKSYNIVEVEKEIDPVSSNIAYVIHKAHKDIDTLIQNESTNNKKAPNTKVSTEDKRITVHLVDYIRAWLHSNGIHVIGIDETFPFDASVPLLLPSVDNNSYSWRDNYKFEDVYLESISPNSLSACFNKIFLKSNGKTIFKCKSRDISRYTLPSHILKLPREKDTIYSLFSPGSVAEMKYSNELDDKQSQNFLENCKNYLVSVGTSNVTDQSVYESTRIINIHGHDLLPYHCAISEQYDDVTIIPYFIRSNNNGEEDDSDIVSLVAVNGSVIRKYQSVALRDQDIISIGHSKFFRLNIPRRKLFDEFSDNLSIDERLFRNLSPWEYCLIKSSKLILKAEIDKCEQERRNRMHLNINREVAATNKTFLMDPITSMTSSEPSNDDVNIIYNHISFYQLARIGEMIISSDLASYYSSEMRRGIEYSFSIKHVGVVRKHGNSNNLIGGESVKKSVTDIDGLNHISLLMDDNALSLPLLVPNDIVNNIESHNVDNYTRDKSSNNNPIISTEVYNIFNISVACNESKGTGKWMWLNHIMMERLTLMKEMYSVFINCWCQRDPMWLDTIYTPDHNSFLDTVTDELVGVAYLYLNSLYYLLDINDTTPIVNFKGDVVGYIKINVRAWIDEIEMLPEYLSVDKECKLTDFTNKKLILVFHFDGLRHLPPSLCAAVYVYFKFYMHGTGYKTIRHPGMCVNPTLSCPIRVEQRITKDFEEYIKMGTLEIEVFGKTKAPLRHISPVIIHDVGEPLKLRKLVLGVPNEKVENEDDDAQPEIDESELKQNEIDSLTAENAALNESLEAAEKQLAYYKKINEKLVSDKDNYDKNMSQMFASIEKENDKVKLLEQQINELTSSKSKSIKTSMKQNNSSGNNNGCNIM